MPITTEEIVKTLTKKNYLRHSQQRVLREDRRRQEEQLKNPFVQDKGPAMTRIRQIDKMLAEQAPPSDLSGPVKDALLKREQELAEKIRTGMQPEEDLRRCPDSSVPHRLAKEEWGAMKGEILEWKACRLLQDPTNDDPNLANADYHLRPKKGTGYSGLMVNAMGPRGYLGYQDVPEQNWQAALGPPTVDTALKQAQRVAAKEGTKPKRTLSPEHFAKLQAGRMRKQQERVKAAESLNG